MELRGRVEMLADALPDLRFLLEEAANTPVERPGGSSASTAPVTFAAQATTDRTPVAIEPILTALAGSLASPGVQLLLGALAGLSGGAPSQLLQFAPGVYEATLNEANQQTGEVSTGELRRILNDKSAVVFDARTALEYAIGHIPGALNTAPKPGTPMSQYVSDAAEIARIVPNQRAAIVVYCNGPFCGKSRRLGEALVQAGYSNVRRYQLGTPMWRALIGPMVIEAAGCRYVLEQDRTAAFLDARTPQEFAIGSLSAAQNVPVSDVIRAKDDGRLPMDDFNTRVIAFGADGAQAKALAEALAHNGFVNVKYCDDTFSGLLTNLRGLAGAW